MAGLFDKQAELYLEARPDYPKEWFSMLASLTHQHSLAWDVGTGNGQAAIAVAENYDEVIATDISKAQLLHAIPHPRVKYIHTPLDPTSGQGTSDDLVSLFKSENQVDLIIVAQAVHWFDLPTFYSVATRLLRKPGGIIAVWGYNDAQVSTSFDRALRRLQKRVQAHGDPRLRYLRDKYKTLSFPFQGVGPLGSEGRPLELAITKMVSFEGFLRMLRTSSMVVTAKERGVDVLSEEEVVRELETAWGGPHLVRPVVYNAFMLVGTVN